MTEKSLTNLRESIENKMSPKRFRHTAEVEKMAARLGELYAPEKVDMLRAAALLHDITKEYPHEMQLRICAEAGIEISDADMLAPKTFHAKTAAYLIEKFYGEFATDEIISAVRWHTTGRVDMTLTEKIIYLADYIDMSRTFEDCVRLREYFFLAEPEKMSADERLEHLDDTLILSFDMTIRGLLDEGSVVSTDTFEARNDLVIKRRGR